MTPGFGQHRFGFVKGQYYWEKQIGPIVIFWQHDMRHQHHDRSMLRIGDRLAFWWDECWRLYRTRPVRKMRRWLKSR
jgi:hypothetical protein